MAEKNILGLIEEVEIIGSKGSIKKKALLDTGATRSSVDVRVAATAGIGPIVGSVKIKSKTSEQGFVRRAIAQAQMRIHGQLIPVKVSIEDRKNMPYKILVGRDIIHSNFMIDLEKTHFSSNIKDENQIKRVQIQASVKNENQEK